MTPNKNDCIPEQFRLRDVQLILSQDHQTVMVPNQTDDLARHKQYEPTICDSFVPPLQEITITISGLSIG